MISRIAVMTLALLVVLGTGLDAAFAAAQEPPDNRVVAVIDGDPVYMNEVKAMAVTLPEQYRQLPLDSLYALLLERVVSMRLLAAEGSRLELDQSEAFEQQLELARVQLLERTTMVNRIDQEITDDALQARYQIFLQGQQGQQGAEEIHARHILLETGEKAVEIIAMLDAGADFAETAASHSTGPSASSGGDLGYFGKGMMVPAFEEAAFALSAGDYSPVPVQTQFGWHVIKLEDRRDAPPPALSEIEAQLRTEMAREIEVEYIQGLSDAATIERFNMDGSAMLEPQ